MNEIRISDNETIKWTYNGDRYCLHFSRIPNARPPISKSSFFVRAKYAKALNVYQNHEVASADFYKNMVLKFLSADEIVDMATDGTIEGLCISECDPVEKTYNISMQANFSPAKQFDILLIENISQDMLGCCILDCLTEKQYFQLLKPFVAVLPIFIYTNSSVCLSCDSCISDSGNKQYADDRIGWLVISKDEVMNKYKVPEACWHEKADEIIHQDINMYNAYIAGEVYGYSLYTIMDSNSESNEWELVDFSHPFYGNDFLNNRMALVLGSDMAKPLKEGNFVRGIAKRCVTYKF